MVRREVKHPRRHIGIPTAGRHALQGEGVDVGEEWLEACDAANGTPQSRPKKQSPKKQSRRPRKT